MWCLVEVTYGGSLSPLTSLDNYSLDNILANYIEATTVDSWLFVLTAQQLVLDFVSLEFGAKPVAYSGFVGGYQLQ